LFTAIGLTPGGSSTVHIYTQTVAPCSGIRGTYKREQSYLFLYNADQSKI